MGFARHLNLVVAISVLFFAKLSWASSLSDAEILNRAAEQRTLVLSVAKNYVLAAANIDVKSSQKEQSKSLSQFTHNLQVLKFNTPNTYIRESLKTLNKDWNDFTALTTQKASPENVEAVIEATNKLVFVADLITANWRGLSSDRELEALNLAHMQAMLSERIGLLYAAHYYGLKDDWVVMELNETLQAYESSLAFLKRFTGKDSEVAKNLEQVGHQWTYAKQGFAKFNQGHYLPKVIAVTMGTMQQEMNTVARHYSQSYSSQEPSFSSLSVPGLAANME
ncbi:MAG: hypothetical protein MI867_15915 [Pseudomonadales bacterium]|nr:hypothetical protein [Pseudomonadales bacterium]